MASTRGAGRVMDGCTVCEGWGPIGFSGRCQRCVLWEHVRFARTTDGCRRCGRQTRVNYEQVCRPCLVEIRYTDEEWVRAERAGGATSARDLQLSMLLPEVRLASMQPLRKRGEAKLRLMPRTRNWKHHHVPPEPSDDERVCPPQVPGQLALVRLPRTFRPGDGRRIRGRELAGLALAEAAVHRLQAERGHGPAWRYTLMPEVRLALAAREADELLVREEDLDQLPDQQDLVALVLREAGLLRVRTVPKPVKPRRRMIGPKRRRGPNKSGYKPVPPPPPPRRSCEHCLAWTGLARRLCDPCQGWSERHRDRAPGSCARCGRHLPIEDDRCRLCRLAIAAGSPEHTLMDQLWLGNTAPPRPTVPPLAEPEPVSEHLIDPAQGTVFPAPPRQWERLLGRPLPQLSPDARQVLDVFDRQAREQTWEAQTRQGNVRVLRLVLAHLGAAAPIGEADVRAISKLRTNFSGLRVAHFLQARGLLIPLSDQDIGMDQAAVARLAATVPDRFRPEVDAWISVLRGQGRRPSPVKEWTTIRRYLGYVLPVLTEWADDFETLRQVGTQDVKDAVKARPGSPGRAVHSGLRSLFRALKRERLIFHDPARGVHLPSAQSVPRPISSDRIAGLLDKSPTAFGKLCVALVAIHAVRPLQLPPLLLKDLNRSKGRLRVGDRIVYLDAFTLRLFADWAAERHRQWPHSPNPHLLVSRRTAMHAGRPPVTKYTIWYQFKFTGLGAQQVWTDRILDEADQTEDPLHLMHVFGLSSTTAVKYVRAAHPEKFIAEPTMA